MTDLVQSVLLVVVAVQVLMLTIEIKKLKNNKK